MPNIYETLIGAPPSGPEETAETASQLRGQEQLGMLGILTGDRVLTKFGQTMVSQVQTRVEGLQKSREAGLDNARDQQRIEDQKAQYGVSNRLARDKLNEEIRNNKAKEEAARLADQFGPGDYVKMTDSAYTNLTDRSELISNYSSMLGDFQQNRGMFEGTGIVPKGGQAMNWLASNVPGFTGKDAELKQAWWASWDRKYNLKQRNLMFGATLTDNEKAVWAAANINPNMKAYQIEKAIKDLMDAARANLGKRLAARRTAGFDPKVMDVFEVPEFQGTMGTLDSNNNVVAGSVRGATPPPQQMAPAPPAVPGQPPAAPAPQAAPAGVNPATGNRIVQWDD